MALALVALGVVWFRASLITAKEAAIHNMKQVDDAMRQASTNSGPLATNQALPRP